MKRPMCVVGFSFAVAMPAAFLLDRKTALILSLAALLTGLLVSLLSKRLIVVCVALISAAVAFAVYSLHNTRLIAPFERASGRIITVEGLVTEVQISTRAIRYTLEARFPKVNLPDCGVVVRAYGESQATVGDVIRCKIELEPATSIYELGRGIRATGIIQGELAHLVTESFALSKKRLELRRFFRDNLYDKLPNETAGIVGTMVMNIGPRLDAGIYAHMNRSGISHMLSISGLHFSILSACILAALRKLMLPRRIPELLAIVLSLLFVIITGFSPPIIRAFLMFLAVMLGQLAFRRGDALNSLGLAMLILSAFRPDWALSLGTWLSCLSTMGILIMGQRLSELIYGYFKGAGKLYNRVVRVLSASAGISIGAYLFTLPLLMISKGWISLVALPANILISPFSTPVLLGGLFCAVLPTNPLPAKLLAVVTDFCTQTVLRISQLLSDLPLVIFSLDEAWMLLWVALVVAAAVVLLLKGNRRLFAWAAMLCACSFGFCSLSAYAADSNKLELVALQGCGTAVLLRNNEAVLLGAPDIYEANTLLDYLDYRGVRRICAIIAPDHGDHINSAMLRLDNKYEIDAIIGPSDDYILDQLARGIKGVHVYPAGDATAQVLGGAYIQAHDDGSIYITVGDDVVYKSSQPETQTPNNGIAIDSEGTLYLPYNIRPQIEPVGRFIYGESRILLTVK